MGAKNRSVLTVNDLMAGDVAVVSGQFNKIGQFVMPAGYYRSIGYGASNSQADAVGRFYLKLQNATPAELTGRIRLEIYTPTDRPFPNGIIGEWHTSSLDSNASDRTKQIPLPEDFRAIGKDYKFVISFEPDTSDTVKKANSVFYIDCTDEQTV